MDDLEKVIQAFENCIDPEMQDDDETYVDCIRAGECPWDDCQERYRKLIDIPLSLVMAALELLKAQEPRVMTLEEVEALPYGYVLIETDKKDSLRWVDALLFCKSTNFIFDFITLEGHARLLGTDYNMEWRCWTSLPTEEQRKAVKWE